MLKVTYNGHVKPYVRANKKFSKKESDKHQYAQYATCKELILGEATEQNPDVSTWMRGEKVPYWAVITFRMEEGKLHVSDIDNLEKTVLDALGRHMVPDDRYLLVFPTRKIEAPGNQGFDAVFGRMDEIRLIPELLNIW